MQGIESEHNHNVGNTLGPSTQADYRECSNFSEKSQISKPADHRLDHASAIDSPDDDLQAVMDAWPTLPEPIRRAVLALVGSAR
jgi:hypothetical protein